MAALALHLESLFSNNIDTNHLSIDIVQDNAKTHNASQEWQENHLIAGRRRKLRSHNLFQRKPLLPCRWASSSPHDQAPVLTERKASPVVWSSQDDDDNDECVLVCDNSRWSKPSLYKEQHQHQQPQTLFNKAEDNDDCREPLVSFNRNTSCLHNDENTPRVVPLYRFDDPIREKLDFAHASSSC